MAVGVADDRLLVIAVPRRDPIREWRAVVLSFPDAVRHMGEFEPAPVGEHGSDRTREGASRPDDGDGAISGILVRVRSENRVRIVMRGR